MDFLLQYLQHVAMEAGVRLDANETAVLARGLEFVRTQTYDIEYPELKARRFIPVARDVPAGAESFVYHQWDTVGMAKFVANYADDLPLVDTYAKEFVSAILTIGDAYQYSILDLQRAAKDPTIQINTRRARVAREAFEYKVDEVAAIGNTATGLPGFVNHPNVPDVSVVTGDWATASPQEILGDMHALVSAIRANNKTRHSPNTLLLPSAEFGLISQTYLSNDNNTTILKSFLANNPWITDVDEWDRLDTAGAEGAPRIMAYKRTPEVVELLLPQEFTELPPQARNLALMVPCWGRIGGIKFYRPLAAGYMDL